MTKDESVYENEKRQDKEHYQDLSVSPGSHLVTAEGQHAQVKHYEELVCLCDLFLVIESVVFVTLDVNEI